MHIYIYIYIERERDVYTYIYIYIYIYTHTYVYIYIYIYIYYIMFSSIAISVSARRVRRVSSSGRHVERGHGPEDGAEDHLHVAVLLLVQPALLGTAFRVEGRPSSGFESPTSFEEG